MDSRRGVDAHMACANAAPVPAIAAATEAEDRGQRNVAR